MSWHPGRIWSCIKTCWQDVIENSDLVVAFGGLPLRNTQVAYGGITEHNTEGDLRRAQQRGAVLQRLAGATRHASLARCPNHYAAPGN